MLRCVNICKYYNVSGRPKHVLENININVERGEKIGILGHNGAGKSTLLRIIGGVDFPTSGKVERNMSVSWPLAFGGAFQGSLSGLDNVRFICRIYEKDYSETRKFVDDFAELGKQLLEPVKTYSSGMRARLAFALSLAIEFDCYLIDEVILVGDARFTERCYVEIFKKRVDRSLIIVSHNMDFVKDTCERCAVIKDKHLIECDSVAAGIDLYHER